MVDIWTIFRWFRESGFVLNIPVSMVWSDWGGSGGDVIGDYVRIEHSSADEQAVHGGCCLFGQRFVVGQSPWCWKTEVASLTLTTTMFSLQISVVHVRTHDIYVR